MSDSEILDQPYDPGTDNFAPETKPIEHVIPAAMEAYVVENVHTWRPAKVLSKNDDGTVNIQTLLKSKYADGKVESVSAMNNVMVWQLRGKKWGSTPPLAVGDLGIALFCERSLDAWGSGDGSGYAGIGGSVCSCNGLSPRGVSWASGLAAHVLGEEGLSALPVPGQG